LGLRVARWLLEEHDVRHVCLVGRRARDPGLGPRVTVAEVDVTDADAVARLVAGLPDLVGVIHAAAVLDDRVLARQDAPSLPTAAGAGTLPLGARARRLELFVRFASGAGALGAPGQANSAAANAFLDGLARHRRGLGLPALSLSWGAWAGGGLLDRLDEAQRD